MNTPSDVPFQQILDALLDESTPFQTRYYYQLSDLEGQELAQIARTWPKIAAWRRQAIIEDMEELGENDNLLSFYALGKIAITDSDAKVRAAGVRLLVDYDETELAKHFLILLTQDPDPDVRALAATGLGKYIYMGEVEELTEESLRELEETLLRVVVSDEKPAIRQRALESLGYSSRDEVPTLIRNAYQSREKEWVAAALYAMGRSADQAWQPLVVEMLISPHPLVREEAARAAGELDTEDARPELLELLEDDNHEVRNAAIWSLSQLGGEGVRDALELLLESAEDDDEAKYLELALDNLSFTEEMEGFALFDLPGVFDDEDDDDDLDDLLDDGLNEDLFAADDDDEELPF